MSTNMRNEKNGSGKRKINPPDYYCNDKFNTTAHNRYKNFTNTYKQLKKP